MRKLALMVGVAAAVAASACSVLGRSAFREPVVSLRDVQVRGLGLTGGSLDVRLSVYNPNHYRLDGSRLNYRVQMAGDSVIIASGTMDTKFTVQDNDSTVVTIPVNFSYSGLGAAGKTLINSGAVNYHVLGDVLVGTVIGSFTVPFSSTGRFTATGVAR